MKKKAVLPEGIKNVITWGAEFLFIYFIINFFFLRSVVPSSSMVPYINPGDRIAAVKHVYRFIKPDRGDVVVFKYPDDESVLYIKRVIGLPGDHIEIQTDGIYINGEKQEETYINEPMQVSEEQIFDVPENCYFMMGDNRNHSNDSRYWEHPFVKQENILGKMFLKI